MKIEFRDLFLKDDTKSEEESPCPPRADVKTDFEGQQGGAEMHPKTHTQKKIHVTHLPEDRGTTAPVRASIFSIFTSRRTKLDRYASTTSPRPLDPP